MYESIVKRSINVFREIYSISREIKEHEILIKPLSGVSNSTFKVELKLEDIYGEGLNADINSLLYRSFGKISELVDRDLECKLIEGLNKLGLGPSILETDNQTYRIEEFIEGTSSLTHDQVLRSDILSQILNIFMKLYTIDTNYFFQCISTQYSNKKELYDKLLTHSDSNVFRFYNKINSLAQLSLEKFVRDFEEDKENLTSDYIEITRSQILKYEHIVNTSTEDLIALFPDIPILVLSHNDAHPGNLLITNTNTVYLIDHELAFYNYLGFEITNFILETAFTLDWPEYPFFRKLQNFNAFLEESNYLIYANFIEDYFANHSHILTKHSINADQAKAIYISRKTYIDLLGASSVYWTIHSVFYMDYRSHKAKDSFDYLGYGLERYSVFEHFS